MNDDFQPSEWESHGYKYHKLRNENEQQRSMNKLADFLLQKLISDEHGKKYYITVFCYDRKKYPTYGIKLSEYGYMPTVQFYIQKEHTGPFFNVEMNNIRSITEVEEYFEKLWNLFGCVYYELYEGVDV